MVQCLIMKYSALFESGPHPPCPPYVHCMSTRHHSCDRCSQAFPVILLLLFIVVNINRILGGGGEGVASFPGPARSSLAVRIFVLQATNAQGLGTFVLQATNAQGLGTRLGGGGGGGGE